MYYRMIGAALIALAAAAAVLIFAAQFYPTLGGIS